MKSFPEDQRQFRDGFRNSRQKKCNKLLSKSCKMLSDWKRGFEGSWGVQIFRISCTSGLLSISYLFLQFYSLEQRFWHNRSPVIYTLDTDWLPFRAFCVVDLKNLDDVRCPMSVCLSHNHRPIIGEDASSAIIIGDYDHHTKISGESGHFKVFCVLWAL